nr:blood group Rh(CE) polypeptide [Meriones unguiculatus]
MGSKYPRSLRFCLPLGALLLQAAFIPLFYFIPYQASSSSSSLPSPSVDQVDNKFLEHYQVFQDLTLVAALGFGFLSSSLRRHGWSSVAFNLFMLALGVQGTILMNYFLYQYFQWNGESKDKTLVSRFQIATMSTVPLLISACAVLGRVNLVQLSAMVLIEAVTFSAVSAVSRKFFHVEKHICMMHGHVFGAYFGLLVAWCLSRSLPKEADKKAQTEKVQMATSSNLFAMLGTLFLWIFWPSFNSALLEAINDKKNAVFNTYYALAVSTVAATAVSALTHPKGKINMIHIHNAVLAGGVAVGTPCSLITHPWIAMVLGLTAGLISAAGAKCQPVCLSHVLPDPNPSGIHYTFGLPGLLGGVTYFLLRETTYRSSEYVFATGMVLEIGALSFAMAMGMVAGLLTGCLLIAKVWRAPHVAKYFDDQTFWEFPHLAVGY